ncbi:MAG TPA: hypothetical protein GXZ95_02510 [Mollicutes bacterium]|nr:hypothetical protein [Mollicutes bacterium]
MSYHEYDDLSIDAQKKGKYQIFVFDIKDSKKMLPKERRQIQLKSMQLLLSVYNRLEQLEMKLNRKILHKNSKFISPLNSSKNNFRGDMFEPFNITGDCFGLTIIRGSIDSEIVYNIWKEEKDKIAIDCEFRVADMYYETDDYAMGGTKYFRGYCMQKAENDSKRKGRVI